MRRLVLFIWYLTGAGILKRYRAARREEARLHEEVADHELRGAQTLVDEEDET